MKLTSCLARFAAGAFIAFAIALALGHGALPLFSVFAAVLVIMSAASDYMPRRAAACAVLVGAPVNRENMPLAA